MRTSLSPGCCVIWYGLHQRVIVEAIDHVVVWTAACLCENWWTRLETLARIIERCMVVVWCDNLTFMCRLCIWCCRPTVCHKTVARFYTVQYEHMKRDVVACAFVFVPNLLEYVSAKNWQNWMTSDQAITNTYDKGDVFFLRHRIYKRRIDTRGPSPCAPGSAHSCPFDWTQGPEGR